MRKWLKEIHKLTEANKKGLKEDSRKRPRVEDSTLSGVTGEMEGLVGLRNKVGELEKKIEEFEENPGKRLRVDERSPEVALEGLKTVEEIRKDQTEMRESLAAFGNQLEEMLAKVS